MTPKSRFHILPLMIAAMLLFVNPTITKAAAPEPRFSFTPPTQVSTAKDFYDWYQKSAAGITNASCMLTDTIVIDSEMTLSASSANLTIALSEYHIRVAAGGSLTVDNPNLYVSGSNQLVQVECGAALHLLRAAELSARISPYVIVYLENGAALEQSVGFPAGNVVWEKDIDPNEPHSIVAIHQLPVLYLNAEVDPPADVLPGEVTVTADLSLSSQDFPIGVRWDLSETDLAAPGYYTISGTLSEEALAANNLRNPKNLTASLRVLVRRPGTVETLTAFLMDAKDQTLFRFPTLPEDVEALYLYQSIGGGEWERCQYYNSKAELESNFLGKVASFPPEDEFLFSHPVYTRPVSYRLEVVGSVCAGYSNAVTLLPSVTEIASTEELVSWYTGTTEKGEPSICQLTADIRIGSTISLPESPTDLYIDAGPYSLWVEDGGTLLIDNPDLHFSGTGPILRAGDGGTLHLRRAYELRTTADGAAQVAVSPGANWQCTDDTLELITVLPEAALRTVTLAQSPAPVYLIAGETESVSLPAQVEVKTEHDGIFRIGVEWDLSNVDFSQAGTYAAAGKLSSRDLSRQALESPDDLDVSLPVVVRRRGPIDSMTGKLVEISENGTMTVLLSLPELPEDVTAVYLYRRSAGGDWIQCGTLPPDDQDNDRSTEYNFLIENAGEPLKPFQLICRLATDYRPVWLKAEITGSIYDGFSNEVKITPPETARPGEITRPPHDPDGDDSGGGRGGGGQGESDRPGKAEDNSYGNSVGSQPGQSTSNSFSENTSAPNTSDSPEGSSPAEAVGTSELAGSINSSEGQKSQPESEILPVQGVPERESEVTVPGGGDRTAIAAGASIVVIAGTAAVLYGRGVYRRKKQNQQKSRKT